MHSQAKKESTDWVVNGIKQAIFKRIFPHIIHEIAGPLSVALLQTGIIKKKLKVQDPAFNQILQHAEDLESHIKQGVFLIRALKAWDSEEEHFFSADTLFQRSVKFFRTKLALRGIELELLELPEGLKVLDFQAVLYCWLALLCYLEDTIQSAMKITIKPVEKNKISIHLDENAGVYIPSEVEIWSNEKIGKPELKLLNLHYNTSIEYDAHTIVFKW